MEGDNVVMGGGVPCPSTRENQEVGYGCYVAWLWLLSSHRVRSAAVDLLFV